MENYKSVALIKDNNGNLVMVAEIKTLSETKIKELKKQAIDNRAKIVVELEKALNEIKTLTKDMALVKLELAYNRGEITEQEYLERKGK